MVILFIMTYSNVGFEFWVRGLSSAHTTPAHPHDLRFHRYPRQNHRQQRKQQKQYHIITVSTPQRRRMVHGPIKSPHGREHTTENRRRRPPTTATERISRGWLLARFVGSHLATGVRRALLLHSPPPCVPFFVRAAPHSSLTKILSIKSAF